MFSQIQTETVQHLNYGARVLVSVIFVPFDRLDSVTNTLEAVCVVDLDDHSGRDERQNSEKNDEHENSGAD
jgi:hypothetical protein